MEEVCKCDLLMYGTPGSDQLLKGYSLVYIVGLFDLRVVGRIGSGD